MINKIQINTPYIATNYPIRNRDIQQYNLKLAQADRQTNLNTSHQIRLAGTTGIIPRAAVRYDNFVENVANRRLNTIENANLRKTFRSDLKAYRTVQLSNALSMRKNNNLINLLA